MYLIFKILVEKEDREEDPVAEYTLSFWGDFVFSLCGCKAASQIPYWWEYK